MPTDATKISLCRQLLTCCMLCGLALAVIFFFHGRPYMPRLLGGPSLLHQMVLGAAIGSLCLAASAVGYKYTAKHKATRSTVESYSRLDLQGWNPLWMALAAGFGEELLFRGALQPLIGVCFTSIFFVLSHTRAYQFNRFSKRVLFQVLCIFAISVVLGMLAKYAGLVTAMIVHTAMDVGGLYTIRRVSYLQARAAT